MAADVHSSAVVDPTAVLEDGVRVGPYCIVGPHVALAERVTLHAHAVITGHTRVGSDTEIFPFAAIGLQPQDRKFDGEPSAVTIGTGCTLREGVTVNAGTRWGGGATIIGDRCLLMAQAHVAHDCRIGDDVVLSNNVMLAGHVRIESAATLGGGVGVHQHARVGEMAFVGGLSGLEGDLIPFGMAFGNRAHLAGVNVVGLRRAGVSPHSIRTLSDAVAILFGQNGTIADRIDRVACSADDPLVQKVITFLRAGGRRPFCRPDDVAVSGASR